MEGERTPAPPMAPLPDFRFALIYSDSMVLQRDRKFASTTEHTVILRNVFFRPCSSPVLTRPVLLSAESLNLPTGPASIWGWAPAGASVSVTLGSDTAVTTTASGAGKWRVSLAPHPASTSATTLTATSGGSTITINDILFGDVWLCSGQVLLCFLSTIVKTSSVCVPTKCQLLTWDGLSQSNMAFSAPTPNNDKPMEDKV